MVSRQLLHAALLGQLLAFLIAFTSSMSKWLAIKGVSAPTLQSALNYLLLAVVFSAVHVRRRGWRLQGRWWAYLGLAALDVEANLLLVSAFRYTSLSSATLLDCFSIPAAVALSAAFLGARYRRPHLAGAALCVLGLAFLVTADSGGGGGAPAAATAAGSKPWLGDVLVVVGAIVYAGCNVVQEKMLGSAEVEEVLAMLGALGFGISLAQGLPLELPALRAAQWDASVALPFVGYGLALFTFYSCVPRVLTGGGAALLNLSLLASDLWAALARLLFFGGFDLRSGTAFLASFALVGGGVALYATAGEVYGRQAEEQQQYVAVQGGATAGQLELEAGKRGGAGDAVLWQQPAPGEAGELQEEVAIPLHTLREPSGVLDIASDRLEP